MEEIDMCLIDTKAGRTGRGGEGGREGVDDDDG